MMRLSASNKIQYAFFLISAPAQTTLMCVQGLTSVCRRKSFYSKGRSVLLLLWRRSCIWNRICWTMRSVWWTFKTSNECLAVEHLVWYWIFIILVAWVAQRHQGSKLFFSASDLTWISCKICTPLSWLLLTAMAVKGPNNAPYFGVLWFSPLLCHCSSPGVLLFLPVLFSSTMSCNF